MVPPKRLNSKYLPQYRFNKRIADEDWGAIDDTYLFYTLWTEETFNAGRNYARPCHTVNATNFKQNRHTLTVIFYTSQIGADRCSIKINLSPIELAGRQTIVSKYSISDGAIVLVDRTYIKNKSNSYASGIGCQWFEEPVNNQCIAIIWKIITKTISGPSTNTSLHSSTYGNCKDTGSQTERNLYGLRYQMMQKDWYLFKAYQWSQASSTQRIKTTKGWNPFMRFSF